MDGKKPRSEDCYAVKWFDGSVFPEFVCGAAADDVEANDEADIECSEV